MFGQKKVKHYTIILTLSLLAFVVHGYQFAVSDQEIFIPFIYKYQDKSLFLNDQIFNQISSSASLYYPILGTFVKHLDIQSVFIVSYLIFNYVFFIAIYKLAASIFNDKKKAYLSLIPFFLPKFIGGTATFTFDTFFGYRSIGVIFLIYYIIYLLKSKFKKASLFAIVGILFHPLSIIPSLMLLPMLIFIKLKKNKNINLTKYILTGIFLACAVFFLITVFFQKNDLWLSVIKERDDYLFISKWSWRGWAAASMYFFVTLLFLNKLNETLKKVITAIITTSLVVFISYWFVLEILKIPQIAKFQLLRSISPIAYIGLVMSPFFLFQKKLLNKIIGVIAFFSLSLNFFNIFLISSLAFLFFTLRGNNFKDKTTKVKSHIIPLFIGFFLVVYLIFNSNSYTRINNKIQYPKAKNDWYDLQVWSSFNTKKSDVFLVPPQNTGFRIFSKRPIVGDIKDGAVVIYSREYAGRWSTLMNDLENYNNIVEGDFKKLQKKYNFNFIVTKSDRKLMFDEVYSNESFRIYKK